MKKLIGAFVLGLFLGGAGQALAEFGWSDTQRLERAAAACEAILKELRGLRQDLSQQRVSK